MPMADGLCAVAMAAMVSMTVSSLFLLILPKVYHKDEKMKRGAAAPLTDLKITSSQKKIKLAEQHDTLAYADDLKIARAHAALFILIKAEIYRKCGRYHRYDINVRRLSLLKIKI